MVSWGKDRIRARLERIARTNFLKVYKVTNLRIEDEPTLDALHQFVRSVEEETDPMN